MVGMTPSCNGPDSGSRDASAASTRSSASFRDRPRSLGDLEPDRSRSDGAARPLEQRDAERLLEFLDRCAQGRLADQTRLGRPAEMAAVGERSQKFQLAKGRKDFHRRQRRVRVRLEGAMREQ